MALGGSMTLEEYLVKFVKRSFISHFFAAQGRGMCNIIFEKCGRAERDKFTTTFKSWSEFSGVSNFPVRDHTSPSNAYLQFRHSKHFIGKQLKLRKSLARHALKELYGRTV
jgi:hypothetical protein